MELKGLEFPEEKSDLKPLALKIISEETRLEMNLENLLVPRYETLATIYYGQL